MSYIDTVNHSYVGTFAKLPVYHVLETIDEDGVDEFTATPRNLVIGGGSGEHPGLVIKNLEVCVWKYLNFLADAHCKESSDIEFFSQWEESATNNEEYEYTYYSVSNLKYKSWSMDTIASFVKSVDKIFEESIKYYKDKSLIEDYSVEDKINIMFGEFIYFTAKECPNSANLLSSHFRDYIANAQEELNKADIDIHLAFEKIIVPPKGYPVSGRYLVSDDEHGYKVVCGLRFDQEHTVDQVLNHPDRNRRKSRKM